MTGDSRKQSGSFGDERLSQRHGWLMSVGREKAGLGFPEWVKTPSELEAIYRFTSNESVTVEALLEPTFQKTHEAAAGKEVLVLHDTTQFEFGGDSQREGLGPRGKSKKADGFFGHFALAASATQHATCVGLLGFHHYVQAVKPAVRVSTPKSDKWLTLIEACEARVGPTGNLVHVMDREADIYALFDALIKVETRFICRVKDRLLAEESSVWLREKLEGITHAVEREVTLSPRSANRSPVNRKAHPARATRKASLRIRALAVDIKRPKDCAAADFPPQLSLNAVQVFEPNPPAGEEPIEWLLLTTQPIDSAHAIERIVDNYRARWLIEEFFKALKTGCKYESRQLESLHALLNALGILAPIAVELLQLREAARDTQQQPATTVLSELRLAVLRAISHQPIASNPTASDVCFAIARLGGHLKNNGFPGWLVLHRGFRKLLDAEIGWSAAFRFHQKM